MKTRLACNLKVTELVICSWEKEALPSDHACLYYRQTRFQDVWDPKFSETAGGDSAGDHDPDLVLDRHISDLDRNAGDRSDHRCPRHASQHSAGGGHRKPPVSRSGAVARQFP
jgi:hypothetical protein